MAELGALSLRIEQTGGEQVLQQVKALDTQAKQTGVSLDAAAKVLTKLGISAKVVGGQLQVAEGQTAKASAIVQKLGVTAQVTSAQEQQLTQSTQQLARSQQVVAGTTATATGRMTLFGREVVTSTGRLSAFSTRTISGLNAAAFAISSLASGGQASFRTLASAAAGFAAFFGPGGAIASIAITAGLAITDFFTRTRREIRETQKTAEEALDSLIQARRERDDPVGVATDRLAIARQLSAAATKEMADLVALGNLRQMSANEQEVHDKMIAAAAGRKATALQREMEALRLINDARAESNEKENDTVETLAASIGARRANSSEIARANSLISQSRFVLEQTRNASVEDTGAMKRRSEALATLTTLEGAFKKALDVVDEAERKRRAELADRGAQLVKLSELNKLTGRDLVALIALEGQLTAELARGNLTLERRAQLETQRAALAGQLITAPGITPALGGGAVGAAQRIDIPLSVQAKLDPATIQADIQRSSAEMAARVRAFQFADLSEALAQSLTGSLEAGIKNGFVQGLASGGIAEGFKQMTAMMLQGLGDATISFALAAIGVSELMTTIAESLASLNPWVALAAGIALAALGAQLGGAARQSFGGGGTISGVNRLNSSGTPLEIRRLVVDPNSERAGGRLPRIGTSGLGDSGPPVVIEVVGASTPRGQEIIGTSNARYVAKRA